MSKQVYPKDPVLHRSTLCLGNMLISFLSPVAPFHQEAEWPHGAIRVSQGHIERIYQCHLRGSPVELNEVATLCIELMQSLFKNKSPLLWIPAATSVALLLPEDSSYVQAPAQTMQKTKAPDSTTQTSQNLMLFLSPRKMQSLLHPVLSRRHPIECVMLCFMTLQLFLVCLWVSGEPDLRMTLVNISLACTEFISVSTDKTFVYLGKIWSKSDKYGRAVDGVGVLCIPWLVI